MLLPYKRGQTSIILRVKLRNSSVTTGAGLTGLLFSSTGLIISTIASNEATATTYTAAGSTTETITTLGTYAAPTATKCRFKEVDATNHPGLYEIHLADARFAVANARHLLVSISGATNLAQCDVLVPLTDYDPYDAVRAGLTALPNAAADAAGGLPISDAGGLDMDAILVDTNSLNDTKIPDTISLANINAEGDTALTDYDAVVPADLPTNFADLSITATSGRVDVGSWLGTAVTALPALSTGTAQAGAAGTITLAAGEVAVDDYYNGTRVVLTGGTGAGQSRIITDYFNGSKIANVSPNWATNPDGTTTYEIQAATADVTTIERVDATDQIRDAILDDATRFSGASIAAIVADTNELQTDWADGGRLDLIVDAVLVDTAEIGAAGAGLTAVPWNENWDAEVESEVNDAIDTAISELGVGAPTATPTIRTAIMLMYMALRNKLVVQTSGTDALEVYNDAGTKIAQKLLTDDGSDYTEAEMTSG